MEEKQQERLTTPIERLQAEIDSFLSKYDPNNQEHILLLFAYRKIVGCFEGRTKLFFRDFQKHIESLIKNLVTEQLVSCAMSFDIDIYFDQFVEKYGQWEKYEISLMELIDSAVYSIVLLDGLGELARYVGESVVSMDDCADQDEKHYKFSESFVWIPMFNEYDRRYSFDDDLMMQRMQRF